MSKRVLSVVVLAAMLLSCSQKDKSAMLQIDPSNLEKVREVSPRYQSYNVEMVEVVGGEFW